MELPNYSKPPVREVAVSVQFGSIPGFGAPHIGLYWNTIRGDFPKYEEQPPIPHILEETSDVPVSQPVQIQLTNMPGMPRIWFITSSGNQVVQVQTDRFVFNWRKVNDSDEYPRYPVVKKGFLQRWDQFCSFLEDQKIDRPQIDQLELTYVNGISQGEAWTTTSDLQDLFTTLKWRTRAGFLPMPEVMRWSYKFLLKESFGRLHVDVLPVLVPNSNKMGIRFSLTVRGRPPGEITRRAVEDWFDGARRWIVKGFEDLVDEKTDILWGKQL